jgi:hypothetical protein
MAAESRQGTVGDMAVDLAGDIGDMALDLAQLRARQGAAKDEAKEIKKRERENRYFVVLLIIIYLFLRLGCAA